MDTLSGEATMSKLFYLPSEKEFNLEGRKLSPHFHNRFGVLEFQEEVMEVFFFENDVKSTKCIQAF